MVVVLISMFSPQLLNSFDYFTEENQYLAGCGGFTQQKFPRAVTKDVVNWGMFLLLPAPFRGMGAWQKTMQPQKPGNSPGPGLEAVKTQRVAKKQAALRVRSWTVQNEMRGVLGRVSAGAAGRILASANP